MSTCLPIFTNCLVSCSEKCVFSLLVEVVRHKSHLKYHNLIATKAIRFLVQHPLCDIFHLATLSKHLSTFYPSNLWFPGGANWSLSLHDWSLNIVFTLTDFCCYLWLCYSFSPSLCASSVRIGHLNDLTLHLFRSSTIYLPGMAKIRWTVVEKNARKHKCLQRLKRWKVSNSEWFNFWPPQIKEESPTSKERIKGVSRRETLMQWNKPKDENCSSKIPNNSPANCVLCLLENSICGWLDYCWTLRESWIFHLDVSFAADCSIPAVKVDFLIG